jgi:hypothetical protein
VCYTERMSGRCPICAKPAPRSTNPSAPFCSARCRQIDLGKWLNDEYRIPANADDDDPSNEMLAAGNRKEPS